jgi:hypothetical protein
LNWNGQSVPVVSFEAMLVRDVTMLTGRTRIALLRTVGDRIPGRLLGVVVQGFPQTLRVTRESLKPDEAASPPERGPVLCRVRMVNESALIPDLESLEAMVADETVRR